MAVLGPCRCVWAFSGCGEWELLVIEVHELLIAKGSPVAEPRL